MKMTLRLAGMACCLLVNEASANSYLPLNSPATGRELVRVSRLDGAPPKREQAEQDQREELD
jgi:hypothetical protein